MLDKKYLLMILVLGIVITLNFTTPYTPPTYNSINFTLCSAYTPPTYNSINFTLGLDDSCVVDTCTCAGAGNDWEIDMSDNCQIDDDCDLTTGTLSFTGAGYTNCNATISTTNLGDPGASGILYIQDNCFIKVD